MRHQPPPPVKLLASMRARLIATFVLVALLGVGSVGSYSFYQYQRDLHEHVDDQYAARNQIVAREIEVVLDEIRGDLLVAASVPPIQGIVRARDGGGYDQEGASRYDEWTRGLEGIFAAIETAYPRYVQLRFLDEQGNELVRVDWDGQQARLIAPAELQNKADRPYFQETMQLAAGQIYVSPLDLNQEWGQIVVPHQPTIRLATPIFNRQGERRGLVILNVLGQAILHRPSALPEGEGIYIFLTDQRGYYLHHSASPEKEWGGPENLNTGHSLQEDFPQVAGQILSRRAGEVHAGPWAISYQPVQIDPLHDQFLVLGLAVPTRLIQASMNRYLWFFGGILALSLLLAVGMGYFAAGRITAPLEALRRGARQIADGRFDQRVQVGGTAEISDLADDFNRMAGRLAELYGSLQAEYQRLFESASDSIIIYDLKGRILAVNENAARRLGYTRDELLRLSVQDLDTPEAAARVAADLQLLMEQGSLVVESAHRRKDGSVMPVEISATLTEYRGQQAVMNFARDITERKRAEREIARRNAELAAQNAIAATISQSLDLDTILAAALDKTLAVMDVEGGGFSLAEPEGATLTLHVSRGLSDEFVQAVRYVNVGEGISGRAVAEGKPVVLDTPAYPAERLAPFLVKEGLQSLVSVPLISKGVALGALSLGAKRPRAFRQEELSLLTAICQQIGVAVENARLYEQVKEQRVEEQTALLRLSQGLLAATEAQAMMDLAVQVSAEVLRVPMAALMLPEQKPNPTHMVLCAAVGGQPEQIGAFRLPIGPDSGAGYAFNTGQPLLIEDLAAETRFRPDGMAHHVGAQAGLVAPMKIGDLVIGTLSVASRTPRSLNENDLHLLSLIANQTAVALERTRLFEETRRRASELQAIAEVGGLVTAGGNLQETLDTLAQKIARATGFAAVGIGLYDPAQELLTFPTVYSTATIGLLEGRKGTTAQLAEAPVLQYLLRERQYLLLRDPQNDPRIQERQRELARQDGVLAVLTMPLLFKEELVGTLDLISTDRRDFSPEDISLLTTLSDQTAMAIVNARLYGQVEKRARELSREVIQQKQYAETVLRSIADGVYAVDTAVVVRSWSRGAEAITGYTAAQAIGQPCADFLRHTDEAGHMLCGTDHCPFRRVWATGKPMGPEQVFAHCKDSRLAPVAVTAAPIFDETGQSIGAVEVFRDVSRERELVASLQAASRAKTRFLANMSHELRTPLNGVLGITQALQQGVYGELNAKQVARLQNVYESGQHLLRLINDLLDLARVEEDRLVLEIQPVSVADLCRVAVQMIQPIADAKRISLELTLGKGPAIIEGDERRLRQVLLNLLGNAVKFTPEQGRVGLTAAGKADGVEFVVWDTGIGIPAERQTFLFQPFSQVDDDLARRYQGSGLGLALVKQLTELHGGWVAMESQPGRGSRFYVWLPGSVKRGA